MNCVFWVRSRSTERPCVRRKIEFHGWDRTFVWGRENAGLSLEELWGAAVADWSVDGFCGSIRPICVRRFLPLRLCEVQSFPNKFWTVLGLRTKLRGIWRFHISSHFCRHKWIHRSKGVTRNHSHLRNYPNWLVDSVIDFTINLLTLLNCDQWMMFSS